jgi:hypothetical protein
MPGCLPRGVVLLVLAEALGGVPQDPALVSLSKWP